MEGAVCSGGKVFFGSFVRCNRAHLIADPLGLGYLCKLTHTHNHTHTEGGTLIHIKGALCPDSWSCQPTPESSWQWTPLFSTPESSVSGQLHFHVHPHKLYLHLKQTVYHRLINAAAPTVITFSDKWFASHKERARFLFFFQLLFRWSLLPSFSFYIKVIQSFITGFF